MGGCPGASPAAEHRAPAPPREGDPDGLPWRHADLDRGGTVKRWIGWAVAVAVIAGLWVVVLFAPQLQQWVALVWAIGLPTAGLVSFVLARRRGERVAETLRAYGPDFISLEDDVLGRPHTAGAAWPERWSAPMLVVDPGRDAGPTGERRDLSTGMT